MNLHIISTLPHSEQVDHPSLALLNQGDTVLLMCDGCYWSLHTHFLEKLSALDLTLCILEKDQKLRGLTSTQPIEAIDMNNVVTISFSAKHIFSW